MTTHSIERKLAGIKSYQSDQKGRQYPSLDSRHESRSHSASHEQPPSISLSESLAWLLLQCTRDELAAIPATTCLRFYESE
jgi:hypothetical protein